MYDGVLQLALPPGCSIVEFTDDIAIVTVSKEKVLVERKTTEAAQQVTRWLVENGPNLAAQKTEAVLISSRKQVETAKNYSGRQFQARYKAGPLAQL